MKILTDTEKLAVNKYEVNEGNPHILIDQELCQACSTKNCLFACPASLYSEQDGEIIVEWAGCFECGTCLAVCSKNALTWQYPDGGFGIIYRYG